jgi:hypothetical protein
VLAQERIGSRDDNQCRHDRDDEKTPAHDLSFRKGGSEDTPRGGICHRFVLVSAQPVPVPGVFEA